MLGKVSPRSRGSNGEYLTQRQARAELEEILAAERQRASPAGDGLDATFIKAAHEWLRYLERDRRRRPSTMRDYRFMVEGLEPVFGKLPLRAFSPELIDAYRGHLISGTPLSPRTVNKYIFALHSIFRLAQRRYGLAVNPAAGIERQPVRRSAEFRVLSPDEIAKLCRAAREGRHRKRRRGRIGPDTAAVLHAEDIQDAAIYIVASYAGLRLGELQALRWRDVDLVQRVLHVRRAVAEEIEGPPKSGRARAVPMIDQVAEALGELRLRENWTDDDDLVFVSSTGSYFSGSALRRRFYNAQREANIRRLRLHDLRHSFGTLAVRVFPLSDVKEYMGHADITTTMIYVHHVPQHDAAAKLSAAVAQSITHSSSGRPALEDQLDTREAQSR